MTLAHALDVLYFAIAGNNSVLKLDQRRMVFRNGGVDGE